jgi:hypothetical protein
VTVPRSRTGAETRTGTVRGGRSLQERFESDRTGRLLISAFLVLTLICISSANLYPSDLKKQIFRVAKPYIYVTGLDQGWDVFSPEPRRETVELTAQISYADSSIETWKIPRGGSLFGAYWDYRWRKWVELLIEDFAPQSIWKPAAQWVARNHADPRRRPVKIELVSRRQPLSPPGVKPTHQDWITRIFYTLKLEGGQGR